MDQRAGAALETKLVWRPPSSLLRSTTCPRFEVPEAEIAMPTFAQSTYAEAELGALKELPCAGTTIENPYVYDASAQELKAMASRGLVKIVEERRNEGKPGGLITRLTFQRLR